MPEQYPDLRELITDTLRTLLRDLRDARQMSEGRRQAEGQIPYSPSGPRRSLTNRAVRAGLNAVAREMLTYALEKLERRRSPEGQGSRQSLQGPVAGQARAGVAQTRSSAAPQVGGGWPTPPPPRPTNPASSRRNSMGSAWPALGQSAEPHPGPPETPLHYASASGTPLHTPVATRHLPTAASTRPREADTNTAGLSNTTLAQAAAAHSPVSSGPGRSASAPPRMESSRPHVQRQSRRR